MSENGLKPGDVVVLKSGGPDMTVDHIFTPAYSDGRKATCKWFDSDMKLVKGDFALEAIQLSQG